MIVRKFPIEHLDALSLLGQNDSNLRHIERALPVRITLRDGTITVAGEEDAVDSASRALKDLVDLAERGKAIEEADVASALGTRRNGNGARVSEAYEGAPAYSFDRKAVRARTPTQAEYLKALDDYEVVFAIGPAGTGKTYLAVACAVDALERSAVQRIVLTRPAVEAGERLGFLPGDLTQKVDPYLRPLYDALYDLMGYEKVQKAFERNVLEIAPLAFMRGRTLNNAFVILDEAQNTTPEQMKMFLTRIGFGARAVVTGDVSQIDLPKGALSGLIDAERVLKRVKGIAINHFTSADVVRHPLVARIVDAYDARGQAPARRAAPRLAAH